MSSPFFTEDHESIREMARDFAAKALAPIAADIDKNEEFPMDVVRKYLPGVVSGEEFIAFGLTEPNAGSDAASMTTKAVADGDSYILNGRKCFITMAPISRYCIVYAKTSPEKGAKGISCFMVDMSLPGVSCGKHEEKMGQRGVPVSDVVLEDVRVPKDCLIGELDLGFINAMKTLSVGRVGVASMCLPTYAGRLVMLAISIVVVSVGVELYLEVNLVPMPMEGMTLALAQVLKKPFPNVKIAVDCTVVLLGLVLSLVFLHRLDGVREGTVIAAVVTGKMIALVKKPISPLVQRVCFGGVPAEADQ